MQWFKSSFKIYFERNLSNTFKHAEDIELWLAIVTGDKSIEKLWFRSTYYDHWTNVAPCNWSSLQMSNQIQITTVERGTEVMRARNQTQSSLCGGSSPMDVAK